MMILRFCLLSFCDSVWNFGQIENFLNNLEKIGLFVNGNGCLKQTCVDIYINFCSLINCLARLHIQLILGLRFEC